MSDTTVAAVGDETQAEVHDILYGMRWIGDLSIGRFAAEIQKHLPFLTPFKNRRRAWEPSIHGERPESPSPMALLTTSREFCDYGVREITFSNMRMPTNVPIRRPDSFVAERFNQENARRSRFIGEIARHD